MKVSGSAVLNAPVDQVWAAFNDPAVLARTLPGCQELREVGPDAYKMTITAGVASIKGTYEGDVALTQQNPPGSFVLKAAGAGAPGTVSADVAVNLVDSPPAAPPTYDADAVVGGVIGGVGQRMLTGVAKKMAGQFFQAVDADIAGVRAPPPSRRRRPRRAGRAGRRCPGRCRCRAGRPRPRRAGRRAGARQGLPRRHPRRRGDRPGRRGRRRHRREALTMRAFTAAAVQIAPVPGPLSPDTVKANIDRCVDWLTRCVEATRAELVVLPESATTGFTPNCSPEELWDLVTELPGAVIEPIQAAAPASASTSASAPTSGAPSVAWSTTPAR